MGISAVSLELNMCMCANNYEVDLIVNQVGQIHQRIRVGIDRYSASQALLCPTLLG